MIISFVRTPTLTYFWLIIRVTITILPKAEFNQIHQRRFYGLAKLRPRHPLENKCPGVLEKKNNANSQDAHVIFRMPWAMPICFFSIAKLQMSCVCFFFSSDVCLACNSNFPIRLYICFKKITNNNNTNSNSNQLQVQQSRTTLEAQGSITTLEGGLQALGHLPKGAHRELQGSSHELPITTPRSWRGDCWWLRCLG